jgi:transposase
VLVRQETSSRSVALARERTDLLVDKTLKANRDGDLSKSRQRSRVEGAVKRFHDEKRENLEEAKLRRGSGVFES